MTGIDDRWEKYSKRLRSRSMLQKLAIYAVLTLVVYGTLIAVDNIVLVNALGEWNPHPDLDRYRDRAQTIIDGDLLYRDVHTETPPIINYLLVPPQLLGGAENDWVWGAYFSLFAFLLASMIYLSLRHRDELKAFFAGGVVLTSPYTVLESSTGQDEPIVVFIFMLAVILMYLQRRHLASTAIGVGIWTKMFPILLFPVHFLQQRRWKDRLMVVLIGLGTTALIALPFVLLCWDDFSFFLNFYFLGEEGRPTGGHSTWHFLALGGWVLPNLVQLLLLGAAMAFAYLYPYYKKMPVWPSVTLMVMVFFAFYPKVHGGYWIIVVALLSVWAAQNRKIFLRTVLAFIPMLLATGLARGEDSAPFLEFYGSWLLGFCLALVGLLLLADAVRLALKERAFIDDEGGSGPI